MSAESFESLGGASVCSVRTCLPHRLKCGAANMRQSPTVSCEPFDVMARALRLSPCSCKSLVRGLGKPGETLCASMRQLLPKPLPKCLISLESGVSLGSANETIYLDLDRANLSNIWPI